MENFYKTHDEQLLKLAVDEIYNDEIGGNENAKSDGNEYNAWKEEELVKFIEKIILGTTTRLELEDSYEVLEAKHIRFIGKTRVDEIVRHRVNYRHIHEGLWAWEK